MFTFKAFPFFLMLCVSIAKSDVDFKTMCKNDYRDMNNTQIDVMKYCSNNLCIEKCCGVGEMFNPGGKCENTNKLCGRFPYVRKHRHSKVNYSNIFLSSWDGKTAKKSKKNFLFVRNHRSVNNCTSEHSINNEFMILENGSIRMQDTSGSKLWSVIETLEYCIDFKFVIMNKKPDIKIIVRGHSADPEDDDMKSAFILIGLLISSFFLLLVFLVYCLLPKLQNLIGLVLMAYTASILATFIIKIGIKLNNRSMTTKHCKIISPVLYFAAVSSFFWLNIMSFDVWWSLRGHRKRCNINRRGELVKFMWYCLYAWGTPLLMTAIVTILDNIDLSKLNFEKTPFDDCFVYGPSVEYYFIWPIGVIIVVNIALFCVTVYNIWMIKRAVHSNQDSRSSSKDTNRFITYIKLSVVMGVSWCLELIPANKSLWLFFLTTTYNLLIGVAIFFLFVFNKGILIKLCKRFNIQNEFTKKLVSQNTKSGTTRTTRVSTVKEQVQEMDLLMNCPKQERVDNV